MPQVSYVQALEGSHPPGVFRDKLVLVGVTATGLGDSLPTPVSGHHQPMSGVEINANLLSALKQGASLSIGIDHPNYSHSISPVADEVRESLSADLV